MTQFLSSSPYIMTQITCQTREGSFLCELMHICSRQSLELGADAREMLSNVHCPPLITGQLNRRTAK